MNVRPLYVVFPLICLSLMSTLVDAAIMHPNGLNLGDKYRYAFVTSTTRDGTSTEIADYDAHVNAAIDAADPMGLGTINWRVWGSTEDVDAIDHLMDPSNGWDAADVPIFLINTDTIIADNFADLTDDSIDNAISVTETGGAPPKIDGARFVFTGTNGDGREDSSYYLGSASPYSGDAFRDPNSPRSWTRASRPTHGPSYPFYAFSNAITVGGGDSAVPEPSSMALAILGIAGFGAYRLRRRHKSNT